MGQNQHIHCLVDNCHYWSEGNRCQANEIMVTSDSFGATQPDEVDAKQSMNLSPTPTNSCTETCCKTFVPHEGDIHLDNIERMTQ
jgi:hypothetical protein